jgi:hypothetical protein
MNASSLLFYCRQRYIVVHYLEPEMIDWSKFISCFVEETRSDRWMDITFALCLHFIMHFVKRIHSQALSLIDLKCL